MLRRQRMSPLEKEMHKLQGQEAGFRDKWVEKKKPEWTRKIESKIPDKLQTTLDKAFAKAFSVSFQKGTGVIEKTYHKEELQNTYLVNKYEADLRNDYKSLRKFSKSAGNTELLNTLISGVSGIGLGVLGIGLPDILLFTGFMLKGIYEIALKYGFTYDTEEEKKFILLIIKGAVSDKDEFQNVDGQINYYMKNLSFKQDIEMNEAINQAAGVLSRELLYMKFLQGIPIVGVIGGAYDVIYTKRILEYAKIKYRRRFIMERKESDNAVY